jgi:beta-glucanase (GH16 family)
MFQYKNIFATAGVAFVLSACGGGGDDSPAPQVTTPLPAPSASTPTTTTPTPTTTTTPTPTDTTTPTNTTTPTTPTQTAAVVWNDEFNGTSLDTTKWGYQLGNGANVGNAGWGNNELEYYTDRTDNVRVEGGNLVITARKEAFAGTAAGGNPGQAFTWTSGRIRSSGKFSRTYGKIEFRAKLPVGKGFWPAVWMLPEDGVGNPYKTWAANGEIDIMEGRGSTPTKVPQTLHYGGMFPNNVYTNNDVTIPNGGNFSDWHTYTLEWRSNEIKWSIDGVVTSTQTKWWSSNADKPASDSDLNAWPAPFDKPFYLLINLAVGGNFDGNPPAAAPDKAEMLVDYIRWSALDDEKRSPGDRPTMAYPWKPLPVVARPPVAGNLIYNPSFDWTSSNAVVAQNPDAQTIEGVSNSYFWNLFKAGAEATATNDGGAVRINITDPGAQNWNVQLQHNHIALTEGRKYRISFDARASVNRAMSYTVGADQDRSYAPYTNGDVNVALTTTMQKFTSTFSMTGATNNGARVVFNLAQAGVNSVWIDNVVVEDIGVADAPATPDAPVPGVNLLKNGDFQTDLSNWKIYSDPAPSLTASATNGAAKLVITNVNPTNNWNVQFNQPGVSIVQGHSYTLTFKGSASVAKAVGVVIGETSGNYTRYLSETASLTPTMNTFTYTFTAQVTNPAAQLQILGAVGPAGDNYTLTFDDVSLVANP